MATGLSTQLTGKIGEHLVTAELARRGIMATPFSGNVPDIDILGFANRIAAPIQVKTIASDSWQFDINKFLNLEASDKGQKILGINEKLDRGLVCIFVALGETLGDAEFYLLKFGWLQDYFFKHYKGRKPPNNVKSYHCAIWKKDMSRHLGKWSIVERRFRIKK
jgi:hypothetical protein